MDGKPQIIHILRDGDVLGYRSILGNEMYPVSAETLVESDICFIPKADFMKVIQKDHELSGALMKAMSNELTHMVDTMTYIAQRPVRERLAYMLLLLNDVFKEEEGKPTKITLSRDDMANMVGTATETLIRLLHDYKNEGIIATEGRVIVVLDCEKLRRLAD
jgi:CRP/FNR family transcriptional regulator